MIEISKINVLIIDDDKLVCDTLNDVFQEKGYNVSIAKNGQDAITKAEQANYNIAIIDIKLPDMDGTVLLKEFKKVDPEKICFIVTGHATLQNAVNALKEGADDFFIKPLVIDDMIHRAQEILEKQYLRQKLKDSEKKYQKAYNRANFYKDLFAHDINNILNNIKGSETLISTYLNSSTHVDKIYELLDIIKEQVIKGAQLISNVQKLSLLEESDILINSMDVCKTLKEAIKFILKSFQTRKISIQVDSLENKPFVQANNLLFDAFENILNNAVKYNENYLVEIFIRISKFQKEKINYLKFEFMDNGLGILDDQKATIFKRDYKKDISVRGMGFGLSLVKKIIESYKGEIRIKDKVKGDYTKGSNFIILIPEVI